jgi:hypothetical protein
MFPISNFRKVDKERVRFMSKAHPKYAVHFRWGDFQLNIVGRRTILWWAGAASVFIGLKMFGAKLLELL